MNKKTSQTPHKSHESSSHSLRDEEIDSLIARYATHKLKPFFAERVLERVSPTFQESQQFSREHRSKYASESFFEALTWSFRRVVLVSCVASLLLLAYNRTITGEWAIDSVFSLYQEAAEYQVSMPFDDN